MGFVYLIYDRNNNSYKIGVTKGDPKTRLKKLQTGNTCELELINQFEYEYPYRLESMLHNHYKRFREKLQEGFPEFSKNHKNQRKPLTKGCIKCYNNK